jgi:chromosome segregation ATPase
LPENRDQQNPEFIRKNIEELQRRYERTTLKPQEEKKIMADIKRFQASIPDAEKLLELKPKITALLNQKQPIHEQINALKAEIESKSKELDQVRSEQEEAKAQRTDLSQQLDGISAEIEKCKEQVQALYNQKDQLREEYHKALYEFQIENDQIKHFEHLARVKEGLINREKAKQERIAVRKQALADRPNPFLKELETCERLIAYCELLKKKVGLGGQTEESIKEE